MAEEAARILGMYNDKTSQIFIKKDLAKKDLSITEECFNFYNNHLRGIENDQLFRKYHYPELIHADFYLKPMVLLIGQYSTGKTSLINYLLGPNGTASLNVGPTPTTDKFCLVGYSDDEPITVPGSILIGGIDKLPFHQLAVYSDQLSSKLEAKGIKSSVTEKLVFIDTPGIRSGMVSLNPGNEQKNVYSPNVIEFFGARSDRIIVFFDVLKLDISEELSLVLKILRKFEEKIIIVLNKLDLITRRDFIEVLSNFMMILGNLLQLSKPPEVFYTCFETEKNNDTECKKIYEESNQNLMKNLRDLTVTSNVMKLNNLISRSKLVKYHALTIDQLARKVQANKLTRSTDEFTKIIILEEIYSYLCKQDYAISRSDLPDSKEFVSKMNEFDLEKYKTIKYEVLQDLENALFDLVRKIDPKILLEQNKMIKAKEYIDFPHYRKSISNTPSPTISPSVSPSPYLNPSSSSPPPTKPERKKKKCKASNVEKCNSKVKEVYIEYKSKITEHRPNEPQDPKNPKPTP